MTKTTEHPQRHPNSNDNDDVVTRNTTTNQGWPFYKSLEDGFIGDSFEKDGFVCFSQIIPPSILKPWQDFAKSHVLHVFETLHQNGHTEFSQHCRMNQDGFRDHAMKPGVKHGFQQVVMRSPGRYEFSLLHIHNETPSLEPLRQCLAPLLPHLFTNVYSWDQIQTLHISLVSATPGAAEQSWHADGAHVSLQKHLPAHCVNVFLPLMDVSESLGPTELRPGSHVYTRNLAPLLLAAKAKKTLRPPVAPTCGTGDALVFDYRILHRGKANRTAHTDRPILVLTLAQPWFVDVCNFPKRSMYAEPDEGRNPKSAEG